jgi:PKD repeat protein
MKSIASEVTSRVRSGLVRTVRSRVGVFTAIVLMALIAAFIPGPAVADSAPPNPADPTTPATVSADALPTAQINGVVWTQVVVGDTVYAGGSFTAARPAGAVAGASEVPRSNAVAYSITTGNLTNWAPQVNGQVRTVAVSPDKTRLYIGGSFTTVNGLPRKRIAAFDVATGNLVATFAPPVNYDVYAIAATNSTVYAGGDFQDVGTKDRGYLAAFQASNGALLDWAPRAAGGKVWSIVLNPDGSKLAVAGQFTSLNGSSNPGYGLGMLDTTTGASLPMAVNSVVRNGAADAGVTSLASDGTNIYGGGYTFGSGGTLEGTFAASWNGGQTVFINDCHGDTYSIFPRGGALYAAGHPHYCGNIGGFPQTTPDWTFYRGIAFGKQPTGTVMHDPYGYHDFAGQPNSSLLTWFPSINAGTYTGQVQGPWSVSGNDDYVVMAGEFTKVNNKAQQGLVRFPRAELSPNAHGPTLFNATYPLNLSSTQEGTVRINWQTNTDIDSRSLTYRVYRDAQQKSGLVYETTASADAWSPYTMGFTDSGLAAGATHRYRVAVTDPFGNIANSPWTSITVASTGTDSRYRQNTYKRQPVDYWRMGEPTGSVAADAVGVSPLTLGAGVSKGAAGAIAGDPNTAFTFNGASTGIGYTGRLISPPNVFSLETWFKTNSLTGGKLIGFGNKQTANSSNYDRQVYLDNAGHLIFGVYNVSAQVVTSPGAYRDNKWHHVVASLSPDGMKLYVDGALVGQKATVTYGQGGYWGYWRVGGDALSGWPSQPSSNFFKGSLDEAAIYHRALSPTEVTAAHAAGTSGATPNVPPEAAFTADTEDLSVSVDGSGSSDSDGEVSSYAWDFGDGSTGTGKTASHTYAAAGTYQVRLTITDDQAGTDTAVDSVTVTAPNVPPKAAFTTATDGLSVSVDGSASTDPDGELTSYAWDFGDGGSGTGATASHSFAAAGTYQIALTVTDDRGATDKTTKSVTVAPATLARDDFSRTVSGGWGSADIGGGWTRSGTATNFNVADGVGTIRMGSAGAGPSIALNGVSSADTEVRVSVGMDKTATGGGTFATIRPRITGSGDSYDSDVRWVAGGTVAVTLSKTVGSVETALQTKTVTGLTVAAGDRLNIRVQATGTSPTTLRTKVWKVGSAEPTEWVASVIDSSASLQGAGAVGLATYLSGSATNAPVVAAFDNLWAGRPAP